MSSTRCAIPSLRSTKSLYSYLEKIEPIQQGHRWVLTYNLINNSKNHNHSAAGLDARISDLTQVLTQCQGLENSFQFLVYPLEYKYTNVGLRLAQLKRDDYHRAHHVAESCAEHVGFYVLLANMERQVTNPNSEEECDLESEVYLTHIADTDGFNLHVYQSLSIPQTTLLREIYDDDRDPDMQRGGEYLGN